MNPVVSGTPMQRHRTLKILQRIGKFKAEKRIVKRFKNCFFYFKTRRLQNMTIQTGSRGPKPAQTGGSDETIDISWKKVEGRVLTF